MFEKVKSTASLWFLGIFIVGTFYTFDSDFNFAKLSNVFDMANNGAMIILSCIPVAVSCYVVYSAYIRLRQSKKEYDEWIAENNKKDEE